VPKRYSIAEARARLPSLIDEAVSGVGVELTRRGKPIVVVLSVKEYELLREKQVGFGPAYRSFLKKHSSKDVGIEASSWRGLRDRSPGRPVKL
jgi:prevent-host-death family protein